MQDRILIVEADRDLARSMAAIVVELNCQPVIMRSVDDGVRASALASFRAILIDLTHSADAVARIRSGGSRAPILNLPRFAANASPGGYHLNDLRAGLERLLSQEPAIGASNDVLAFGELEIRLVARTVHVQRRSVAVSPKEFELITYFARHAGQVIPRTQLLQDVWHLRYDPGTNVVDVHVGRLRRKLEQAGADAIRTARGEGYIFVPAPTALRSPAG